MYPNDKLPVGDEFKNIERYDEKQQKNRTRSNKMRLVKEESPEKSPGRSAMLRRGLLDKCEPSYETIHKLCELFAFKCFVAETAIRIKSPVNSWYFQPLFFACCQYPDYKAFLHWRVIQSYLVQQGLLCMDLIYKKF